MMTQKNAQAWRWRPDPWSAGAAAIAALVLLPMAAVVWIAFHPTENIWPHLMSSVLPRYAGNTVLLMAGVGVLTAAVGAGAAWIVTMYDFPLRRLLDTGLLFPLALPAYIGAYALVDFLDYSGPLQVGLRALMGWPDARAYWFPQVRSAGFAIAVLSAALYPYVYLLARAAFREQSGCTYEVARSLGTRPVALFFRVGLPLARPAIAAGVALALMETVADYGTVQHFGIQTLTTGVFTTWLDGNNAGGAAQIACVMLGVILVLVLVERAGRRGARYHRLSRSARPVVPQRLHGAAAALVLVLCLIPFGLGFAFPVAVMAGHALKNLQVWADPGLFRAAANSLLVGGAAAALTVTAALFLVYGLRLVGRGFARWALPLTTLGYAAPGAVLAVGILIPLAALDHGLADLVLAVTGTDPGLLLTGTAVALVLAYTVRFFGVAEGAVDAAFGRISPSLPMAARSLGRTAGGALRAVYLPLTRGSIAVGLLVVFVDCVKELPATLLLRPFNFNTLATRTFELASLERLGQAAPAALVVIALGLAAVLLMVRAGRD